MRAHGTYVSYVQGKCRCQACRDANSAYERRRRREAAIEAFNPHLSRLVDADPARGHMRTLMAAGMGWKRIAQAAGVSNGTAYAILYGKGGAVPAEHRPPRRRIRRDIAERILAVRIHLADGALVDATGTTRRLRALVAIGWPQRTLAANSGVTSSNATPLFDGTRRAVQVRTARAVKAIHDDLWQTPGPSTRARNDAARKGWLPPLAWDDDTIDDPDAEPSADARPARRTRDELVEDWHDTWDHHQGDLRIAASRLGVSLDCLAQALRRAAADGIDTRRTA